MSDDLDLTPANSSDELAKASPEVSHGRSILPQSALDAADAKIAAWSGLLVDAADTIERLVGAESLPLPDGVRELATTTIQKLRSFGTSAGETEAAELVAGLQRRAAAHPAAAIGIGAAVGAALATLLVRLSPASDRADPGARPARSSGQMAKTS